MPQMAPIMWMTMFFIFSTLFFLTKMKIYYNSPKKNSNKENKINIYKFVEKNVSWKW